MTKLGAISVIIGWIAASTALHAAPADELHTVMALPAPWASASVKAMAITPDHERVCVASSSGGGKKPSGDLMLIDRVRRTVAWQATVPVPEHFVSLDPVQCLIDGDRVFLLAHVTTRLSFQLSQNLAYVAQFDMQGKRLAGTVVSLPNQHVFAYGMTRSGGVLKVTGATVDTTPDTETYATYTVGFDEPLRQRPAPLIRKNGAYVAPFNARIVGDSVYVGGRFFKASANPMQDVGDFSASQLRIDGGYRWSQRTLPGDPRDVVVGIAENGTVFTMARDQQKTLLSTVGPDGKTAPPLSYASRYCGTRQITGYADGALAIRHPCAGTKPELVFIDPTSGAERTMTSMTGTPLFMITQGDLILAISVDDAGKAYLETSTPTQRQ